MNSVIAIVLIVFAAVANAQTGCPAHDQIMHTNPVSGESRIVFTSAQPVRQYVTNDSIHHLRLSSEPGRF